MKMQFDDRLLETTWQEIEFEIKKSSQVGPQPGFTSRWKSRLKEQRRIEQRRQAWIFVGINTVTAIIILGIIGALNFPASSNMSEVFVGIITIFSKLIVHLNMLAGVIGSILRTIPKLIPSSSWTGISMIFGTLFILWYTTIRKVVDQQGNLK